MTWSLAIAVPLAFAVGLLVGVLYADTFRRLTSGKARRMSPLTHTRTGSVFRILIVLTLLGNMMVGVLLIRTRQQVADQGAAVADQGAAVVAQAKALDESNKRVEALGLCVAGLITDTLETLDERGVPATETTVVEEKLWRELRTVLLSPDATLTEITAAISDYLASLDHLQATRKLSPYPNPNRCSG